ncbi:MAG TPA: hypothetical protein VGY56_10925 [Verrucomicrobiae bacterium]|nr:hypothetical protein [Verrucomicrobiae bacterium]
MCITILILGVAASRLPTVLSCVGPTQEEASAAKAGESALTEIRLPLSLYNPLHPRPKSSALKILNPV